nr:hypothetical protein [Sphingomonas quercus]
MSLLIALGVANAAPAVSQTRAAADAGPASAAAAPVLPGYADLADLAFRAPVAAVVTVVDAIRLKKEQAVGVAPGQFRFYVTATVDSLIKGSGGLTGQVSYLVDLDADAKARPPKPKGMRFLLLADRVPGRDAELRLVAPEGHMVWSAPLEQKLRDILTAAAAADAPPIITGVRNAFHVPGALPGESETQIFLDTADKRPISLNVLRRPGEAPRWAVALGEIVDESAKPPAPDTLLWYRLACALPPSLPAQSTANLSGGDVDAARADYALVLKGLGPCGRTARGN